MTTVFDLTLDQLANRLSTWGEPLFRAKQVWMQLWRRAATYEQMSDISPALRERLAAELPLGVEVLDERTADRGSTRKALLRLGGKHVIETVLMGYPDRVTVCVSSQSGCAMGCTFCATGQMGLRNNLTAGEIAAQVVWARREAARLPASTPKRLSNVVFMGMGEPFDQCSGSVVCRLQVRLNSMQPHGAERMTKDKVNGLGHVALPGERSESVETQVGVVEAPSKDLAQVHDADDGIVLATARQEASKVSTAVAVDVVREGGFIIGWRDPRTVQGSAEACEREEFIGVVAERRAKIDASARLALFPHQGVALRFPRIGSLLGMTLRRGSLRRSRRVGDSPRV